MAALALVASLLPGCSIAFVKDPPKPVPADGQVICTTSPLLPAVDFALAAATVVAGIAIVHELKTWGDYPDPDPIKAGAVTAAAAAPWVASGIVGLVWTHQCRQIKASHPPSPMP